jgi:hypothetical protein
LRLAIIPDVIVAVMKRNSSEQSEAENKMWWQAWSTPMMIRSRFMVTCPCCKGKKRVLCVDAETGIENPILCCHCEGEGEIAAEDPEQPAVENKFKITVGPSLQRNEMSKYEKREHLRSMGIKDEFEIEKIIVDVFHPQEQP